MDLGESDTYYYTQSHNPHENFLNEWVKSQPSQDPSILKNKLLHLANDEIKQQEFDLEKKIKLKQKLDENNSKNKGGGIPFSVKDLQGIIYDFLSPNKSLVLEHDESQLSELLETNTGKMIMVENFLHLFNSYNKTLKEQRLQILQNLTKIKDSNSFNANQSVQDSELHPVKRLKLDDNSDCRRVRQAFYSVAEVYEMDVNQVTVIRRKSDDWVNATTILKAAGICKGRKKRKTLESISGNVQIIQGGYWKLQGTW